MKTPKGYKITVYKVKIYSKQYMYDCRIWHNGTMIQHSSGTLFSYAKDAREYGKYLLKNTHTIP